MRKIYRKTLPQWRDVKLIASTEVSRYYDTMEYVIFDILSVYIYIYTWICGILLIMILSKTCDDFIEIVIM